MTATARSAPAGARAVARHRVLRSLPYLAPALLLYGVFLLYPMIDSVRLSFFSWSGYASQAQRFAGLKNYRYLLTQDTVFWTALRNSMVWVVLSVAIPMVLSLLMALALNRRIWGRNVFRSIFYIPSVFASITVAAVWRWIYNPTLGVINQGLDAVGLHALGHEWLGDPRTALYSIFIASVWQGVGFNMVLFLAGLQVVPAELIDAARVDGAGRWQVFRNVTWPALRPTTVVVGMTGGGPAQSSQVLALWSYQQSFSNHNFGAGGAVATVLLVLSLCLVVPYLAWSMKGDD